MNTWEAWSCTRCGADNAYRGFCSKCGAQLVIHPTGTAPTPPPPKPMPAAAEPPPPSSSTRSVLPFVATALVVLLVLGAGAWFLVGRKAKLSYPKAWDPRVADIAAFVEHERGLTFKHPVAVDFLTPAQFSKRVRTDSTKVTAADRADMEHTVGVLRAVGLVSGKVDLLGATNQLQDQGTLALYDFHTKRVNVRGTQLTPSLRVTLAHELTHAAQDQHFDLSRLDKLKTQEEDDAFRSVVEGDAVRIENRYADTLNEADRKLYDDEQAKQQDSTDLKDVPPAITAFFASPYALGSQLVTLLDSKGGNSSVDEALRTPPANQAQLLDPFRFLAHESATRVPMPALPPGDKRVQDDGRFGALTLYFVLAGRLDPHQALKATDDWAGDAMLDYTHAGKSCVDASFAGTSLAATDELGAALTAWTKTMPAGTATTTVAGGFATLHSCDPGEQAATPPSDGASTGSLALPVSRAAFATELIKTGAPQPLARCVADKVVGAYSIQQLSDDNAAQFQTPAFVRQVQGFAAQCR